MAIREPRRNTRGEMFAASCIHEGCAATPLDLEPYYCGFVSMLTAMDLHDKTDICRVLAYMAKRIVELTPKPAGLATDG